MVATWMPASWATTWSGLARPSGSTTAVGSTASMAAASAGATSSAVARSARREVLVVDEVEPPMFGAEDRERGEVLLAPERDDIVTGHEASERVPLGGCVGIARRSTGEHGHHGRPGVGEQQVAGAHRRVVEVRRDHDHAVERVGWEHAPGDPVVGHGRHTIQVRPKAACPGPPG